MLTFIVAAIVVVVLIVVFIIGWVVRGQNNLVHADELCGNAMSQIGVQQQSRWDALTALAGLTKNYSDHEYKAIMDTIAARKGITNKSSAAEAQGQEQALTSGVAQINALAEAYPDLKANTLYIETMQQVKSYEENVRMSRMVYNDTVTKYNRLVRSLPGSLLAGGLGFGPRDYLEENTAKTDMPNLAINPETH